MPSIYSINVIDYERFEALKKRNNYINWEHYEQYSLYYRMKEKKKMYSKERFYFPLLASDTLIEMIQNFVVSSTNLDSLRRIDFARQWRIEMEADSITQILSSSTYFANKLNDTDSTFLSKVLAQNGFLPNSLCQTRLFMLSSTHYLLKSVMLIEQAKAKLKGWQPLNLSQMAKLSLIILSLLFFYSASAKDNLFVAVFFAFFIVFFVSTISKTITAISETDKDASIKMLFGVLSILSLLTVIHTFFYKYKIKWVSTIINVQLFSLLGVITWVLDERNLAYGYDNLFYYCLFFLFMALFYRKYLSLPIIWRE